MATERTERVIVCRGGITPDGTASGNDFTFLENLLAAGGEGFGFRPRQGITPIVRLYPGALSGCRVFVIKDSDDPELSIIAVVRCGTGEILNIWEHRDQKGRVRPTT